MESIKASEVFNVEVRRRMSEALHELTVGEWKGELSIEQHSKAIGYADVLSDMWCLDGDEVDFIEEITALVTLVAEERAKTAKGFWDRNVVI